MNREELKRRSLEGIERHRDEILRLGEETYRTPELGYKEFRTADAVAAALKRSGLEPERGVAYTGLRLHAEGRAPGPNVAIMGELDCIMCADHPDSDPSGCVHACGHHVQLANLYGAVLGLVKSGVMEELDGSVDFVAIPAEECVDYEYRCGLIKDGIIRYMGGKQEYLYRGGLNHTDMALQCHMLEIESGKRCVLNTRCNGFMTKVVRFIGRSSHAGFAPEEGINALNMAGLAMNNIHALRETFRDEDKVRVSLVMKSGGELVNVVPAEAVMEIMVRAFTIPAMEDASRKVSRAVKAAAMALGGQVEIQENVGYLPLNTDPGLAKLYEANMEEYGGAGPDSFIRQWESAGSTDLGDLSQIMPCLHVWSGGVTGGLHTRDYRLTDPDEAYLVPARMLALTVIDLLYDRAQKGREILAAFRPSLTRETYLQFLENHKKIDFYDASDV